MTDQIRTTEYGKITGKVIFFFVGFGTKHWLYIRPIQRLMKAGYHVVVFDYDDKIVWNGSEKVFLRVGAAVVKDIEKRVRSFKQQGVTTFHCFGTSMGTLFAVACTTQIPEINKVVLNLSYGSVAHHTASWKPDYVKRHFLDKGITLEQLDEILRPISPAANADKLKGKQVLLYLAQNDKVLHFKNSIKLKQALDKYAVDYDYYETKRLGHVASGFYNFLRPKIYLEFLTKAD